MKEFERTIGEKGRVLLLETQDAHVNDTLLEDKAVSSIFAVCLDKATIDLYHTYDFSDKVISLENSPCYGSLFNYVKTGIMTEEEMLDALLN